LKLPGLKRIVIEDFNSDEQALIGKLAFIINPIIDVILQALNKNLSINDNFNQTVQDFSVRVNASGVPITETLIKYGLKTPCKGIQVINVKNTTNTGIYPSQTPFVSFEQIDSSTIKIKNVSGLVANNNYTITTIIYAS